MCVCVCVYYFCVSVCYFFPFELLTYLITSAKANSGWRVTNRETGCPEMLLSLLLTEGGPGHSAVAETA